MDKSFVFQAITLSLLLAIAQNSRAEEDALLFDWLLAADASGAATVHSLAAINNNNHQSSPAAAVQAAAAQNGQIPAAVPRQRSDAQPEQKQVLAPPPVREATPAAAEYATIATIENTPVQQDKSVQYSINDGGESYFIRQENAGNSASSEDAVRASVNARGKDNMQPAASSATSVPLGRDAARQSATYYDDKATNSLSIHHWFQKMVGYALEHSPEVREAQSNREAADWGVEQVKGQRYPQVLIGSNAPFGSFGSGKATRNNNSISDTNASVSVTTTIFDWGKTRAQLDSAIEGLSASELTIRETREGIASTTMTELLNLSRYRESIEVAKAYVKRMKELTTMLSGIAAVDKGRASERVQAQARLLAAKAEQERLEHMYDNTRIKLVRLMGIEPTLMKNMRWDGGLVSQASALEAVAVHPSLLRAKAEIRAAEAQAEAIQADRLPKVNWVVQKSTAKDTYGDEDAWYTGLNLQWNAFDGGSTKAARQAALAKMRSAQEKQQTSRYELEYQIRNMIETRDSSLQRANSYVRLSAETDRVRDMFFRQWYNLGTRTLLDVLTAESDHFNNQLSAINNYYDGYISNVSVMYQSGTLMRWLAGNTINTKKM